MKNEELNKKGLEIGEKIYGKKYEQLVEKIKNWDPELADWLVEHAFGEVLSRDKLDLKTRMLCNVASLTALGIETLLESYIKCALNVGATEDEVKEVIIQQHLYAGWPRMVNALGVLQKVSEEQK